MDEPITDVVVVTSVNDCPREYNIIKETPCGFSANVWEKVFGGRGGERYICYTKNTGENDTVIEDMIIPPPSQKYLRRGYRAISDTPDGEEPLRHKQLVLKRSKRSECPEAVVDIVVYRSKDEPAHNFRKLAKVNDLLICVRSAKITPTSNKTTSKVTPVQKIAPVEKEHVQVDLQPVVESSPNVDALLDEMDGTLKIGQDDTNPTGYQATSSSGKDPNLQYPTTNTTMYSQTGATYSIPEPTSTYSSSQTAPSSYSMPDNKSYATGSTQGATTYPASTQSSSSYSNPSAPYSDTGYSNPSAPYSDTGYSNPSAPYSGTSYAGSSNTEYPTPHNQYSNTTYSQSSTTYSSSYVNSGGQYSTDPYSNVSYSNASYSNASYSNQSNPYANAGYSNASYSGSGLPYSMNPTANSGAAYSNPQYQGYSTMQPPPNTYPGQQYTNYQYPASQPANQGYGGYPPPQGSYGGNQSAYPPTTTHFSGDIGF